MPVDRARHGRQIRLADVGEEGQARLCAWEAELTTTGPAAEIERTYLARAGVILRDPGPSASPAPHDVDLGIEDGACREVAGGALAALVTIRAALGLDRPGGTS